MTGATARIPTVFKSTPSFRSSSSPIPDNPQELYLESLKALGIDPRQHDIRFVEDNWEQPAIAAWGLGWEVWLDGQEITQFTYFQQMGGVTLDPVSVEITYGLERILIALNNAKAIWDEEWGAGVTYGEIIRREEFEHCKYYYEVADVERARQMYELYSAEADACLAQGLIVPAHDYVLKSSHTFNILDARGAISVTERQAFFRRMRELARRVAEGYEEQRKELEYPLLKRLRARRTEDRVSPPDSQSSILHPSRSCSKSAWKNFPPAMWMWLRHSSASVSRLCWMNCGLNMAISASLPRRGGSSFRSSDLAPNQPDREDLVKGPPADKAFDKDGIALPAAMGFAKKNGVDTKDLEIRDGRRRKICLRGRQTEGTPDSRSAGRRFAGAGGEHQVRKVHALE